MYGYGTSRGRGKGGRPDEGNFVRAMIFGTGVFVLVLLLFYAMSSIPLQPAPGTRFSTTEWPMVFAQDDQLLGGYCETQTQIATGVTTLVVGSCVSEDSATKTTVPIEQAINQLLESNAEFLPVRSIGSANTAAEQPGQHKGNVPTTNERSLP